MTEILESQIDHISGGSALVAIAFPAGVVIAVAEAVAQQQAEAQAARAD